MGKMGGGGGSEGERQREAYMHVNMHIHVRVCEYVHTHNNEVPHHTRCVRPHPRSVTFQLVYVLQISPTKLKVFLTSTFMGVLRSGLLISRTRRSLVLALCTFSFYVEGGGGMRVNMYKHNKMSNIPNP